MTYVISEPCVDVKDKSCVEVCPVDCIHETDDDRMLYIDPDECIDCGACVDPCPVDAIYAAEDLRWSSRRMPKSTASTSRTARRHAAASTTWCHGRLAKPCQRATSSRRRQAHPVTPSARLR